MDLLTVPQAAKYLSLSRDALYDLVKAKKIPHYRFGARGIRLTIEDCQAWLASKRVEPSGMRTRTPRHDYYQFVDPAKCGRPSN